MNIEEIIINLKLLSQVEKGQKIITKDTYLNIETRTIVPECIRRWNRQDSRHDTLRAINRVVNDALSLINSDVRIRLGLKECLMGITNLKDTYTQCHQTCARIDMILDKIKMNTIEDKNSPTIYDEPEI
jgi:hypothetical protein